MNKNLLLILALIILISVCRAQSILEPTIRSHSNISLLQEPELYDEMPIIETGLNTAFDDLPTLGASIIDALSLGPARYSLITYMYKKPRMVFDAEINFIAGYEHSNHPDFDYGFLYKGMRYQAQYNSNIRLRSLWYNGAFFGDTNSSLNHSPLVDGYYKINHDKVFIDNLVADLSYTHPNFRISLGRDRFGIGNNISGSIILSDKVNDYGYLFAEAQLGNFGIALLHGSLMADSLLAIYNNSHPANSKHYPDKYLALHQLSYRVPDKFDVFFGESIVYGDRGLDINYLLPHAFWRVTEHNLHNRDNILIYGGANIYPTKNLTWYTNAIIDEMRYSEILGDWWGNKYALQSGISYRKSSASPRFSVELTAVRPWIYTHYLPWSYYSHDRHTLGYHKGSNLLDYSAELHYPLPLQSSWNCHISYTRQGETGNNYALNYIQEIPDIDNTSAAWLEGKIHDKLSIQNIFKSAALAHHKLMLGHRSSWDKEDWTHELFAGWMFTF